jgi:molybdopterin synthase sulfur carrier subunit
VVVKVRLFAALRELAGSSEVEVDAETVGDVLEALSGRFGERFDRIARAGSALVDGERASAETRVPETAEVAILPPVSGGAAASTGSYARADRVRL